MTPNAVATPRSSGDALRTVSAKSGPGAITTTVATTRNASTASNLPVSG